MTDSNFKIAVLISGGGTTLKNLIDWRNRGKLTADIVQVISSSEKAKGNSLATENSIPLAVMARAPFENDAAFSDAVFEKCRQQGVELVVMGGFLKRLDIPSDYENRVINIHPSLIPAFSGKGFYGLRVHTAVIDYGCKISGCSVHFVDNQYDHGPIIAQRALEVKHDDTAESLAARMFKLECDLYPEIINRISENAVTLSGRQAKIR